MRAQTRLIDGHEARLVATFPIADGDTYKVWYSEARTGGTPFALVAQNDNGDDMGQRTYHTTIKQAVKLAIANCGWG